MADISKKRLTDNQLWDSYSQLDGLEYRFRNEKNDSIETEEVVAAVMSDYTSSDDLEIDVDSPRFQFESHLFKDNALLALNFLKDAYKSSDKKVSEFAIQVTREMALENKYYPAYQILASLNHYVYHDNSELFHAAIYTPESDTTHDNVHAHIDTINKRLGLTGVHKLECGPHLSFTARNLSETTFESLKNSEVDPHRNQMGKVRTAIGTRVNGFYWPSLYDRKDRATHNAQGNGMMFWDVAYQRGHLSLPHEVTHMAMASARLRNFDGMRLEVLYALWKNSWFFEGVASWATDEGHMDIIMAPSQEMKKVAEKPLQDFNLFNFHSSYVRGYLAFKYIESEYGIEAVQRFVKAWICGKTIKGMIKALDPDLSPKEFYEKEHAWTKETVELMRPDIHDKDYQNLMENFEQFQEGDNRVTMDVYLKAHPEKLHAVIELFEKYAGTIPGDILFRGFKVWDSFPPEFEARFFNDEFYKKTDENYGEYASQVIERLSLAPGTHKISFTEIYFVRANQEFAARIQEKDSKEEVLHDVGVYQERKRDYPQFDNRNEYLLYVPAILGLDYGRVITTKEEFSDESFAVFLSEDYFPAVKFIAQKQFVDSIEALDILDKVLEFIQVHKTDILFPEDYNVHFDYDGLVRYGFDDCLQVLKSKGIITEEEVLEYQELLEEILPKT